MEKITDERPVRQGKNGFPEKKKKTDFEIRPKGSKGAIMTSDRKRALT